MNLPLALVVAALFAATPDSLELQLVTGEQQIVVEHGEAHGLPVRGVYEVWTVTDEGEPRQLAERSSRAPRVLPSGARIDRLRARELAASALDSPSDQLVLELVYLRQLNELLLAWEASSPLAFRPGPVRERVWISATSGAELARRSLVSHSGAHVYPEDPASTPEPIEIEFQTLDIDLPGQPLRSPSIEVFGCADETDETPPPWWPEGQCMPLARARSDAQGDYYVTLPNLAQVTDSEAHDDAYSEVAAYWFIEQFFTRMAARGVDSHLCDSFSIAVNQYGLDDTGERLWLDEAYFLNECDADLSPTLLFGQGRYVDYAWDGDLVFHEMAHSLIEHLTPEGLNQRQLMTTGIVAEASALNEGLSDYFAVALSGDPELGEYIGRASVGLSGPYLRTTQNEHSCPRNLVGQAHNDGQVVSAALWSARVRVGEVVDEIVLQTLPRLAPDASLEDFAHAFMATSDTFVDAGALDSNARALIERSLAGRGLLDCLHVIDDPSLVSRGKRMNLPSPAAFTPFAPGPLQLRYEVPAGESEVTVFFAMSATDPAVTVLLRRGGQPVSFSYASVDERIEVTGEWDVELEAESLNGQDFIARVAVEPGEVLHVALANRSQGAASMSNFFVTASTPSLLPTEGCGCTQGQGEPRNGLAWMGLLALVGFLRPRSRARVARFRYDARHAESKSASCGPRSRLEGVEPPTA